MEVLEAKAPVTASAVWTQFFPVEKKEEAAFSGLLEAFGALFSFF